VSRVRHLDAVRRQTQQSVSEGRTVRLDEPHVAVSRPHQDMPTTPLKRSA
jgi:hypothetical protein